MITLASEVSQLVDERSLESSTLEYKEDSPDKTDSSKLRFLAEVCALANTRGGVVLLGVAELKGKANEIVGISSGDIDSEILRLEQLIRDGCEPKISKIEIVPIRVDEKTVLAVNIDNSWAKPHVVSLKNHGKFYGRNSAGKYQMDVEELRRAFSGSEEVPSRIREFRSSRVEKLTHRNELAVQVEDGALLAFHLVPLSAFSSRFPENLVEINRANFPPMECSGWNSRLNLDGKVTFSGSFGEPSTSYTQSFRNGVIEAVCELGYVTEDNRLQIPAGYEYEVIKSVTEYLRVYDSLGLEGPFYFFLSLIGVDGAMMYRRDNYRWRMRDIPTCDRAVLLLPECELDSTACNVEKSLKVVFDLVWNAFGLECSYNYNEDGVFIGT